VYSDDSIAAAGNGLRTLRGQVARLVESASGEKAPIDDDFRERFLSRLNDDLNMPQALAVVQALLKAELPDSVKLATIQEFDAAVLGLELDREAVAESLTREILELMALRKQARADRNWAASDRLRDEIQALGYVVQDGKAGMQVIQSSPYRGDQCRKH
jgi:cysteinyl-tRNA synthetase